VSRIVVFVATLFVEVGKTCLLYVSRTEYRVSSVMRVRDRDWMLGERTRSELVYRKRISILS
jgi:hypothetical protein